MRSWCLLLVSVLVACGSDEPPREPAPPTPPAPEEVVPEPRPGPPPPIEGLEGLDLPVAPGETAPPSGLTEARPEHGHGCVVASETRVVLENAGRTSVAAGYLGQLIVAAYVRGPVTAGASEEALAIARVTADGPPSLITRIPLPTAVNAAARTAPPGLATLDSGTLLVAVTDGAGRLLYTEIDLAAAATAGRFVVQIDDAHADARFAPAIAHTEDGTRVVAWTDGSGTPMHVRMARIAADGTVAATTRISADGGGAAPVVGLGESEPALYLVEARVAMSAVHRVALGADGTPAPAVVARPILRGADMPAIAVARAPTGTRTHLAYAAVGNLATRAVGLVQTVGTDAPLPLVPGLGYGGSIDVAATPLIRSVVFAMEAPSAAEPAAPHEVRIRVATDEPTLGDPLVLPSETAPEIVTVAPGVVAVGTHGARITYLRCTE